MRKQDYLVNLIRGLEPNEKRYFKLFSSLQPGEKRYLKLFDALEKKTKYEATELCAELGLQPRQLADDKLYLTQILLQALRNYDQDGNELALLRNNRENAQSLMNRRMFAFALDIIQKTLDSALELEAFELADSLLVMRSSCRQNLVEYSGDDDSIKIHKEVSMRLTEIIQLMHLRGQARDMNAKEAAGENFGKILKHPLIKTNVTALKSLRAKSLRYETLAHFYANELNLATLLKLAREERQLYLKNPVIKIINPIAYLTNLTRLANGEQDFEIRMKVLSDLQKELGNPEIRISNQRRESILYTSHIMSLWNLRHLHRFKEAIAIAEKINGQQGRTEYERFSVAFEYAIIALHNNKPDITIDKVEDLLSLKSETRSDVQPFIRLLLIMAQLHTGNFALVPHTIKATRFWLKNKSIRNNEVDLFLKHAGAVAKAGGKRGAWQLWLQQVNTGQLTAINDLLQFDAWLKTMLAKAPAW